MLEELMLVLLGVLITTLIALGLAPVLWNRAVKVTSDRLHDEVRSQASADVSRRYEGKLADTERSLRAEIAELEASRDKISAEASDRVSELEQTRTQLEGEIANLRETVDVWERTAEGLHDEIKTRDAKIADLEQQLAAESESGSKVSELEARLAARDATIATLSEKFKDLGTRAEALAREAADLGAAHDRGASGLHNGDAQPADEAEAAADKAVTTIAATPAASANEDAAGGETDETGGTESDGDAVAETDNQAAEHISLADRIRALRDGAPA